MSEIGAVVIAQALKHPRHKQPPTTHLLWNMRSVPKIKKARIKIPGGRIKASAVLFKKSIRIS